MTTTLPPRSTSGASRGSSTGGSGASPARAGGSRGATPVGGAADGASPWSGWSVESVGQWLRSPVAPYYLILVTSSILALLGLVMVLSASGPSAFRDSGSSYTVFTNQLMYAGIGIVLAVVGSRLPTRVWRALAWPAVIGAVLLQLLVFSPLGLDAYQGNRNWISIGGRALQPSEFGKIGLIVFGAAVLATKRQHVHRLAHATIPFIFPFGLLLVGLVLRGHDLGTALIFFAIMLGMLWAAGLPGKWFLGVGGIAAAGIAYIAAGSANRMQRIQVWLGDICHSPHVDGCFQKVHAEYALADGGWWGLGLGESREKWGLLPEPHNDFILAIIGEELGLGGTLTVLALFAVLAYACFRIITQAEDTFTRLAAAGVMIWFLSQALLNIGSVIGMLPIIGVPLPLVSSGGSALIATLMGVGLLLALARSLPGARERLTGRTSALRRTLAAVPAGAATRASRPAPRRGGAPLRGRGARRPGGRA